MMVIRDKPDQINHLGGIVRSITKLIILQNIVVHILFAITIIARDTQLTITAPSRDNNIAPLCSDPSRPDKPSESYPIRPNLVFLSKCKVKHPAPNFPIYVFESGSALGITRAQLDPFPSLTSKTKKQHHCI